MKCPSPISIKDPNAGHSSRRLTVPCGKCGACKHNRRNDWTFRLQQELKVSSSAYFITLTYSDENLPTTEHGEVTLCKRHTQLLLKKLRKDNSKKIRYYTVGEYGTETDRPHYHSIMFNLDDKVIQNIEKYWKHGHCHVGQVSAGSIYYVSKYHVNTRTHEDSREPEFATMSRRPGIGANYIDKNKKLHRENLRFHVTNNGYPQRMPKYYVEKIFTDFERKLHAERIQQQTDTEYDKEVERLEKLQISDPDSYMLRSEVRKAKKILHKAQEGNLF